MAALPPAGRSRLSPPLTRAGHAAARPGLVEFLRELTGEQRLSIQNQKMRCGLASTPWQLQQSSGLLRAENPGTHLPAQDNAHGSQAVALILDTSLNTPCCGALGTWWLRQDGHASVHRHPHFRRAADTLQAAGHRFADIEAQALCRQATEPATLLEALLNAAMPVLQAWGVTHLTVSCAAANAMRFRSELGFEPVLPPHTAHATDERILLHRDLSDLRGLLPIQTQPSANTARRA